MKKNKRAKFLLSAYQIILIFVFVAFVLSCNIMLFLNVFSKQNNIIFDENNIKAAAILTFWNVVFISVVFTIVDLIRRKIMVERPVKKILKATERITQGDFTARIQTDRIPFSLYEYDSIIDNLNKMAQELSSIETLRTDFVASVSHELKTPLAVLQNYGTLLQSPDLTEAKRIEYAKAIVRTTSKFSDLISNILQLNKLENQKISPRVSEFCISEQICECMLDFESSWESKNIEIETDIQSDVFIKSDEEKLALVWNNLISNAVKFTDNGGKITVSLKDNGNNVTVSVSDSGIGMNAETGKHIFEKFYQGDTSRSTKGNGLGLALVKRVVDILNGDISVESTLGKGSTFTVTLWRD